MCALLGALARRVAGTWGHPGVLFPIAWAIFLLVPAFVVPGLLPAPRATILIVACALAAAASTFVRDRSSSSTARIPVAGRPVRILVVIGGLAGIAASVIVQRAHGYSFGSITSLQAITAAARTIAFARYGGYGGLPASAVLLLSLTYAAALAAPFAAARGGRLRRWFYICWPTIGAAAYAVATTARAPFLIAFALTASASLTVVAMRPGGRLRLRTAAGFILGGAAVAAAFVWVAFARAGTNSGQISGIIFRKIGIYAGGSTAAFNTWLDEPHQPPQLGVETFAGLIKYIAGRPDLGGAYQQFVPVDVGGSQYTNVYTALRQLTGDFTSPGAVVFILLASLLAAEALRHARARGSVLCAVAVTAWNAWILFSQTASIFQFTNVCLGLVLGTLVVARYVSLGTVDAEHAPERTGHVRRDTGKRRPQIALVKIASPPSHHLDNGHPAARAAALCEDLDVRPPRQRAPVRNSVSSRRHPGGTSREAGHAALIYWLAKAVPGLLLLGSTVLLVRLGGQSAYGVYSVVWSASALAGNLAVGWQTQAALRFTKDRAISTRYVLSRTSVASLAGASFLACAVALPLLPTVDAAEFGVLAVGAYMLTAAGAAQTLLLALHQANLKPTMVFAGETVRAAASLGIPILLLWLLPTLPAVALVYGMFLAQLVSLVALARWNRGARWSPSAERLRAWWQFGWPMGLWLAGAAALQFSDRFFLQHFWGSSVTGSYSGVYDLLNRLFVFVVFPVTMATHPLISRLWNTGHAAAALRLNRRAIAAQLALAAPVIALALALRGIWLPILLGQSSHDFGIVLPITLGVFSWQLALSVHKHLEMTNRTRLMLCYLLIALATNAVLNYLFVPTYGASASAWATLVASTLYLLFCLLTRVAHATARADETSRPKREIGAT